MDFCVCLKCKNCRFRPKLRVIALRHEHLIGSTAFICLLIHIRMYHSTPAARRLSCSVDSQLHVCGWKVGVKYPIPLLFTPRVNPSLNRLLYLRMSRPGEFTSFLMEMFAQQLENSWENELVLRWQLNPAAAVVLWLQERIHLFCNLLMSIGSELASFIYVSCIFMFHIAFPPRLCDSGCSNRSIFTVWVTVYTSILHNGMGGTVPKWLVRVTVTCYCQIYPYMADGQVIMSSPSCDAQRL